MKITDEQKQVIHAMYAFSLKQPRPYFTVGGYAGVGKTTIAAIFRKALHKKNQKLRIAYCSFTGRASRVLSQKLKEADALFPKDFVGTIHSLIYSPLINKKQHITGWKLKDDLKYDLLVIDEASMINKHIFDDLLSFSIPIIAVGDHGQLPPIEGSFNLMENPHMKLETIHRQAADNPIIQLSMHVRKHGSVPIGKFGEGVEKINQASYDAQEKVESLLRQYSNDTLVICGYNRTRVQLNNFIRVSLGFESERPIAGDRLICLRNNHEKHIFNGMLGRLQKISKKNDEWYSAEIEMDNEEMLFDGKVYAAQFGSESSINFTKARRKVRGDLFDFGYALTVHKAQGSQAKRVIVFEERFKQMDDDMWRRWLYTAVTRAEEELYVVGR